MSFETAVDRACFIDAFGREAFVTPAKGGERRRVFGIFDDQHATFDANRWPGSEYQMQSGAKFSSTGPRLECLTASLAGIKQRARVEITPNDIDEGGDFTVQDVQPDGTGMTVLMLIERDE